MPSEESTDRDYHCSVCGLTLTDPKTVGQLLDDEWVCDSTSDTPSDCELIHKATA